MWKANYSQETQTSSEETKAGEWTMWFQITGAHTQLTAKRECGEQSWIWCNSRTVDAAPDSAAHSLGKY